MKINKRLKVSRQISEYNGVSTNGAYKIGTYEVMDVLDGEPFVVTALTREDKLLKAYIGTEVDCELTITCRSYKDKLFNNIVITAIHERENEYEEKSSVLEKASSFIDQQIGADIDNDLPF